MWESPSYVRYAERIFPARLTEVSTNNELGEYRYGWIQQEFSPFVGSYQDAEPALLGSPALNYATELSGALVEVNTRVWLRLKGSVGQYQVYEFDRSGTGLQNISYSVDFGDGVTNPLTVTHSLNTSDVHVTVIEVSTGEVVYPTVTISDDDNISLSFVTIPTTNQYRVVIHRGGYTIGINSGTIDGTTIGGTTPGPGTFTTLTATGATVVDDLTATGDVSISDGGTLTVPNTGVKIRDTDSSHTLSVTTGSDLTANRTLSLDTGDASRTLTIPASGTLIIAEGSGTGQTIRGGTGASESLTLTGTNHATPGDVISLATSGDTNAVRDVFTVQHATTGTATTGFGAGMPFVLENAAGTPVDAAQFQVLWTDATNGSEDADIVFRPARGGTLTEAVRFTSTGAIRLAEISTPATPASGYGLTYFKSDGKLYSLDDAGTETELGGALPATPPATVSLTAVPTWFLVETITHADLTDADFQQDILAYTLPAKAVLHGAVVRTKTVGSGGGVAALSTAFLFGASTLGGTGNGLSADDVDCFWYPGYLGGTQLIMPSWGSTTAITIQFSCDVNLDTLSGGEWEVYLLLSTLG